MANIRGTNGPDTLTGTPGDDHIEGKGGNDVITGGGGNDTINGGQGIDVANYSGNFADYTLTFKGHDHDGHGDGDGHGDDDGHGNNGITVADHVAGRDGTDTLKNVEFLHFNDANFDVALNVTHFSDKTIDSLAVQSAIPTDPNFGPAPGTMWFGHGNLPTNYNIADLNEQNIELGLKLHVRTGPDFTPTSTDFDGTAHYNVTSGHDGATPTDHALWNFDYVANTGFNGSASKLSDFDFKMVFTQLAGTAAGTSATFDLVEDPNIPSHPGVHNIWVNEANHASAFGGDDQVPSPLLTQVTENSENLGFRFFTSVFGPVASSTAAGTKYDIQLEAFSHDGHGHHQDQQLIGSVHDVLTLV